MCAPYRTSNRSPENPLSVVLVHAFVDTNHLFRGQEFRAAKRCGVDPNVRCMIHANAPITFWKRPR